MSDHLKVVLAALSNVANLVVVAVAVTRSEVVSSASILGWKERGPALIVEDCAVGRGR